MRGFCHQPPRRDVPNLRRLIILAYLRDRSRYDLSVRLCSPATTITTHLRRALIELRATMFASTEARIGKVA